MAITGEPTAEQLVKLWEVCKGFIDKHEISCAEATVEDRVYEHAPELVENIGNIVGYWIDDEDQEELDF